MTTYADIAEFVAEGKTDAEIQPILDADPRTVRNVEIKDARRYAIAEWGLMQVDPVTGTRSGPLIDLYAAMPEGAPGKVPLRKFINHLMDNLSAEAVTTATDPEYAAGWHQMEDALAQLPDPVLGVVLTPERRAILRGLHGGRRFEGVTIEGIARIRRRELLDRATLAAQSAFSRDEAAGDIQAAFAGELGGW